MWDSNRRPLPEWIRHAYELIVDHADDPDEGLPRERDTQCDSRAALHAPDLGTPR